MTYTITLAASDVSFPGRADQSILEAAEAAGRNFPFGCKSGTCGSCKGRILSGTVDHGPMELHPALSPAEMNDGFALFCRAHPQSDLTVQIRELGGSEEMQVKTLPVRVKQLVKLAPDVMLLGLALPKTEVFNFHAGQYIEFLLKDNKPRAFSLANAPGQGELLELHIRHYPGGTFSGLVFNELREGAILRIRGPYGQFVMRPELPGPKLFVAGGTGFAPIKGLIESALGTGSLGTAHLYWGARTQADLYLHDLAAQWSGDLDYRPVLSEAAPDSEWSGESGMVHEALARRFADVREFNAYVSGPPPMVRAVRETLIARGLAADRFFSDSFESASP